MELSLEASFRSARPRALGSEGCLKRKLHFLEALGAVTCKLALQGSRAVTTAQGLQILKVPL